MLSSRPRQDIQVDIQWDSEAQDYAWNKDLGDISIGSWVSEEVSFHRKVVDRSKHTCRNFFLAYEFCLTEFKLHIYFIHHSTS